MKWITLCLLTICSTTSLAQSKIKSEALMDLLEEIRDPVFTKDKRREYLEFSRMTMVKMLAEEMAVSEEELQLTFIKNPTKLSLFTEDNWRELLTEFYTTVHQANFQERWLELQSLVTFTDYGKNIYSTMMTHLGNYSPRDEGRYYLRWSKMELRTGGKTHKFQVPYILMSKKIKELVETEAHVPYEELVPKKELSNFVSRTGQLARRERQEIAEKMEFNRRIYKRAIINGAKTLASIHHLSGVLGRPATEKKVSDFIESHCVDCSSKEKAESLATAMAYLDFMKTSTPSHTPTQIVSEFCNTLRASGYQWNVNPLKPTPSEFLKNQASLVSYYVQHKLRDKNQVAMAKTILAQDLGTLFLTKAINLLDKEQTPVGTRLQCTSAALKEDAKLVLLAIEEATNNVDSYLKQVNQKIKDSEYNLKLTNRTLEYFVQTNQAATIEATSGFPQGNGWVLKTLAELDQNVKRRSQIDEIVTWGGLIVGAGLTLTGVGAPEGVAILISSAGLVKGVTAGSYYFIRSKQEKKFARDIQSAKNAGSFVANENLKKHYEEYKDLKINYIKEFGTTAFVFSSLYVSGLKGTGGNIPEVHRRLEKIKITAKATGKDVTLEALEDMILGEVLN